MLETGITSNKIQRAYRKACDDVQRLQAAWEARMHNPGMLAPERRVAN